MKCNHDCVFRNDENSRCTLNKREREEECPLVNESDYYDALYGCDEF